MHTTSLRRAADEYVALGWAVIPFHVVHNGRCSCGRADCGSPGKHPRVRWQRFQHAAPTAAQVAVWWQRWPSANVGVITGTVSKIVVVDIDPRNGGEQSLVSVETRWGRHADTVEVATGGGGRHLWFACSEAMASGPIAPGIDLKAEGGVILAPPSLHATGRRYDWCPGHAPTERPLAPQPEWLHALASPENHAPHRGSVETPRTDQERDDFAAAWARAGVELRPGDHTYLCPFHDDHHPSLHVDAEGCRWMCFGCGRRGGIGALHHALGETEAGRDRHRIRALVGADAAVTLAGDLEVDVVGEAAHQDALLALTGGRRSYGGVDALTVATLGVDPSSPLDPDAVIVSIGDFVVGRLRRVDARRYRQLLAYTAREHGVVRCAARVIGGWERGRGDVGLFGVRVLLPELEDVPR